MRNTHRAVTTSLLLYLVIYVQANAMHRPPSMGAHIIAWFMIAIWMTIGIATDLLNRRSL